jgi:hypothetical protein
MTTTLIASVAIAAVSTLGDFIWATWIPRHMVAYGLAHGLLLFCAVGLVLGRLAGRAGAGAVAGAAIGVAAAGVFYLVSPLLGAATMFLAWAAAWMALGGMYARLSRSQAPSHIVLARGAIAATASGLAFYLISGIWRPFDPQGWDYAVHLAAWTFAYFPGFAALLMVRGSTVRRSTVR